jgi:hypothetical protein
LVRTSWRKANLLETSGEKKPRLRANHPGNSQPELRDAALVLVDFEDCIEAGQFEKLPEVGAQTREPKTVALVDQSPLGREEHTEAVAGDVVQLRAVENRRPFERLEEGLDDLFLGRVEPPGEANRLRVVEVDFEDLRPPVS